MHRLRKWAALPLVDKWRLLRIAGLVLLTRLLLALLPFQRACRWLDRLQGPPRPATAAEIDRIIWLTERVTDVMLRRRPCLTKALAARLLLTERGYATDLRIGVRRGADGSLQAHAWLEHAGDIVIGTLPDLHTYQPLQARS